MAIIEPNYIIGRTYLSTPEEYITRMRLCIVEAFDNPEYSINQDNNVIHFRAENDYGTFEEIQTINQVLNKIEDEDGQDNVWRFRFINAHQGPLDIRILIKRDVVGTFVYYGKME